MVDLEQLKNASSKYSTEELIKFVLLESDNFLPEALKFFKEEIKNRQSDISDIMVKESMRSGVVENTLFDATYALKLKEAGRVEGKLFLTTRGIFFIPSKFEKGHSYPYGIAANYLGPLGLIVDEIFRDSNKNHVNHVSKEKELPLSLLVKITDFSCGVNIAEIKNIECWKRGKIRIETKNDEEEMLYIQKSEVPLVISWLESHRINYSQKKSIGAFFS